MVIYYRGTTIRVTHEVFEIGAPRPQRFAIADLRDVHVVRGGPDPELGVDFRGIHLVALVLAGVAASWPFIHSPQAWLVAAALVTLPAVLGGACWRINPPDWALRATYHAYQVELFRCSDGRVFGQVRRALMRVLEEVGER